MVSGQGAQTRQYADPGAGDGVLDVDAFHAFVGVVHVYGHTKQHLAVARLVVDVGEVRVVALVVGDHFGQERVDRAVEPLPGLVGAGALDDATCCAIVLDVVGVNVDVAYRGHGAFGVVEAGAIEGEVAPGSDQRSGSSVVDAGAEGFTGDVIDLVVVTGAVKAVHGNEAGDQRTGDAEVVVVVGAKGSVLEAGGIEGKVTTALHRTGDVVDLAGPRGPAIAFDTHIAKAIKVAATVGKVVHGQRHVAAAEQQPLFINQRRCIERNVLRAAQGASVQHAACIDPQVGRRGDAPGVGELPGNSERAVRATGNAASGSQVQLVGAKSQHA